VNDVHEMRADERSIKETPVEARQGTGPRNMTTVLTVSLVMAAIAGAGLLAYFFGA
jgi:hypothetical protein